MFEFALQTYLGILDWFRFSLPNRGVVERVYVVQKLCVFATHQDFFPFHPFGWRPSESCGYNVFICFFSTSLQRTHAVIALSETLGVSLFSLPYLNCFFWGWENIR